jgi:SAM-dependent methyltransferase
VNRKTLLSRSDFEQNATFYNDLAEQYDLHLTGDSHNLLARRAFTDLVERYVPPGSTLLDFGCGTGLDALHYAQHGYRVWAYDNSPGMVAQLEHRCEAEIASQKITPWSEEYPSFLDHFLQLPTPHAVVANFAVLNSIGNLKPLFDTLARNLVAPGWIIISILNPIHWSKIRMLRWWLNLFSNPGTLLAFTTQPSICYLHFISRLVRAARPFHLVGRGNAGALVRYDSVARGDEKRLWWIHSESNKNRLTSALWRTFAYKLLGHFVFLVLRRDP